MFSRLSVNLEGLCKSPFHLSGCQATERAGKGGVTSLLHLVRVSGGESPLPRFTLGGSVQASQAPGSGPLAWPLKLPLFL